MCVDARLQLVDRRNPASSHWSRQDGVSVAQGGKSVADECFVIGPIGDPLAPVGSEGRERYEESIVVYENVIQAACSIVGLSPIRADEIALGS